MVQASNRNPSYVKYWPLSFEPNNDIRSVQSSAAASTWPSWFTWPLHSTSRMVSCPSTNSNEVDQSSFWDSNGIHWDQHRIGWAVAGACTLVVSVLLGITVVIAKGRLIPLCGECVDRYHFFNIGAETLSVRGAALLPLVRTPAN